MSIVSGRLSDNKYPRVNHSLLLILSFLIPVVVMVLAAVALHVTPFGDHSFLISDAKFYINGEMWFSRLLRGQENILYSFNNGLGGNEWSQFAWGGFGFGNLLSIFASLETIPSVFTWICVINIAICGLTMFILLAYITGYSVSNLIFSTSYAMIGFNVVNCYQTGFLMGPQLLPLVILGLTMLFKGKSPLLYIFSLAFCTFFNFYFAFHLCVISLLYFVAYLCVKEKELEGTYKRFFLNWLISSLIAGLLAAPMWLPALKAFSGGGRLNQTGISEYTFNENMPFIQIFSKLFTGANSTNELVTGLPNIFCGILVVALVILYFMNKSIDLRHKRAAAAVLVLYLITFYIPAFTIAMHGGTHTNWFPYRYSYVFSFLLICLAVEEFKYINELTFSEIKRCGTVLLLIVILVFSTSYEFVSGGTVLLDLLLLALMALGFWFYKTRPDKAPFRTFSLLLLILVCINQYANYIISTKKVQEWELDLKQYASNIVVSGALIDALNMADQSFFRMEKDYSESDSVGADSLLYNYNGVSHSGPAERMFVHQGLNKLGINWFDMRHWYAEGVPAATDSLLGLKYLISGGDLAEEKGYEKKGELQDKSIYVDQNALPVSILSERSAEKLELGEDVFKNLNAVWKGMTGESEDLFTKQEDVTYSLVSDYSNQSVTSKELQESAALIANKQENSGSQSLSNSGASSVSGQGNEDLENSASYILYTFEAKKDGPVYVFDTSIPGSTDGLSVPSIRYVGTYHTGDQVEGKFPVTAEIGNGDFLRGYCVNQVFAYADNALLAKYAEILNNRDISFNVVHENQLTGTFTAGSDQCILFTIPWDEGWACYIDGQKAAVHKTWDLFMSVDVPEGQHTYEMRFFPAWVNYGLMISGAAFAGLIVFTIVWRQSGRRKEEHEEDDLLRLDKC